MDETRGVHDGDRTDHGDRVRDGAVEALRAMSGLSLIVFPEEGRRAALPEGRRLANLADEELAALREGATALTVTERMIARDGEPWLVQQTGPAWAESDEGSAELCGIIFTRLDGSARRHAIVGRPPGPLPDDAGLRQLLDEALTGDAEAENEDEDEGGDEGGGSADEGGGPTGGDAD